MGYPLGAPGSLFVSAEEPMRSKGYSSRSFCLLVCLGAQSPFIALQLVHG